MSIISQKDNDKKELFDCIQRFFSKHRIGTIWLNDTFYSSAFSEADQSKINTVTLENPDNRWKRTKGGNNTTDKVFCLSVDEIVNHYEFNEFEESEYVGDSQQLITPATEYAEKQGVCVWTKTEEDYEDIFAHWGYTQDCINSKGGFWWLRTPGNNSGNACLLPETVMQAFITTAV